MKKSTTIVLPAAIILAGLLAMFILLNMREDTPRRPAEARPKIVETAAVALGPVETEIVAYGRAVTAQPIQLYAEVTGTVESGTIPFKPAQSFSEGDLLVKIDARQARLDLNSAKSRLMTALASVLPEIKVDFPDEYQVWQDYFNALAFDQPIEPLPEAANQKIRLFLSRFQVYQLYFSVRDLEIRLDKHYFHAPFDGSILSTALRVGSTARNGQLLGEIISLEEMEVAVPVKANDLRWIDRNRPVRFVSSEIDGEWTGRIVRIGSDINDRTQTVEVFIAVDAGLESPLLNGVFLEAHIPGREIAGAFTISPRAIYEDRYVYVIEDGQLDRREVEIVRRENDRVIIAGGLNNGEVVVSEIMQGVAPGMPAQSKNGSAESRGAE